MIRDLFLNATILISSLTIWNLFFKEYCINPAAALRLRVICGVGAGILGCTLMFFTVKVDSTVILDFRNSAIILASIFGGFVSSIIACLIIGVFRIFYFGVSASSIAASLVVILIGVVCPLITLKVESIKKRWIYSTLLVCIIGTCGFLYLVSNITLLISLLSAYWIGSILVAVFLFIYTENLTISNHLYVKYKEESTKDFLTGLNNVRQFDKAFNTISNELVEKQECLSLLFIDIDFFKKVNDTYGHAEGDSVLKELSHVILKTCRNFDVVSRNGGEEFSVMLMDCILEHAVTIAERLRLSVEKHKFILSSGKIINLTISIGIATYPDTTKDINQLIKDGDQALYKAKQSGRNKVVVSNFG